jgi:hypothetical protein
MRLWSLHPKYLDSKGLVALWREGLLAQHVLMGKTKGYKHHPQLKRFKAHVDPIQAIGVYLCHVEKEAARRGYQFDKNKIPCLEHLDPMIMVTDKQLRFELGHLRSKLQQRDLERLLDIQSVVVPEPHPIFVMERGEIADWEMV